MQNQNEEFELDVLETYKRIRYFALQSKISHLNFANILETTLLPRLSSHF